MDHDPEAEVRVAPGGAGSPVRPTVELRILVLAEFGGRDLGPVSIDKSLFAGVLRRLAPRVSGLVPDRLGRGRADLPVEIPFTELDSFSPVALARSIVPLAELLEARRLLNDALRGDLALAELGPRLRAACPGAGLEEFAAPTQVHQAAGGTPATSAPTGDIDALLSQVDLPAGTPTRLTAASLASVLAAAVVPPAGGTNAGDRESLRAVLAEVDVRLSRQLAAVSELRQVRALESAWRGLKFLVDRADFRAGITLEIVPTSKDDLLDDFYARVFKTEYDGMSDRPLTLVVADVAIDRSPGDLELLQNAARMAASLRVPFVFAVAPEFFGVRQPTLLATLPDLVQKMRSQEYAKWNRFRQDESALWVAMTANRVLLRDAWGTPGAPVGGFDWQPGATESPAQPLWGSGVWALAAAVAQGFADAGARFPIAGGQRPALLEDLPLRPYRAGKSEPVPFPLEVMLSDKRAWELAECGFAPLVAQAGRDQAFFASAPTFSAPRRYDREEATRASFLSATLPYQLFAGVASARLQRVGREVRRGLAAERLADEFAQAMLAFLAECGERPEPDEVNVEVTPSPDTPLALEVMVRLRPRVKIYGGDVDLVLGTVVAG